MAEANINSLSQILKDYYMEDTLVFEIVREWTCPLHDRPKGPKHEMVCKSGLPCDFPYDCPHSESVETYPGCPQCATAEWVNTLDENGEEMFQARMQKGIRGMLDSPFLTLINPGKEPDE